MGKVCGRGAGAVEYERTKRECSMARQSPLHVITEFTILAICLPLFAFLVPGVWIYERLLLFRTIRVGTIVSHHPALDMREDRVVVDVSRLGEGLVGIKRRRQGMLGTPPPSAWSEAVEFITVKEFWVPHPILGAVPDRAA